MDLESISHESAGCVRKTLDVLVVDRYVLTVMLSYLSLLFVRCRPRGTI